MRIFFGTLLVIGVILTFWLGPQNVRIIGTGLGGTLAEAVDWSDDRIDAFATSRTIGRIELTMAEGATSRSFTDYRGTCLRWDPVSGAGYPIMQGSYDGVTWETYRSHSRVPYIRYHVPPGAGAMHLAITRRGNERSCT